MIIRKETVIIERYIEFETMEELNKMHEQLESDGYHPKENYFIDKITYPLKEVYVQKFIKVE